MRRALLAALLTLLLCGCAPAGTPQAGYDTLWYRAFPTPTPSPTPTPAPPVTATPTPAPQAAETDAFVLYAPYPYTVCTVAEGLLISQEDGRQLWCFRLDADTASAAFALPLSLLSPLVAGRLGDGAEITLDSRTDAAVAGRSAVLFSGSGRTGGQTLAVRAYAVQTAAACEVFVLSWQVDADAEQELTALLHTLVWK